MTSTDAQAERSPPVTDAAADTTDTSEPGLGGRVLFRSSIEFPGLKAEVYVTPIAAPPPIAFGDGHCDITLAPGEGNQIDGPFFINPPGADVDLGANLTATDGTEKFMAPSSNGQYTGSGEMPVFAVQWTITNSGSATVPAGQLATFTTPAQVMQPDENPISTTSPPVVIAYSGGQGAQTIHINILSTMATVDCYPAVGTTSFTLPPQAVAVLDPMVSPRVWAESVTYITMQGRQVMLRFTADNLD